MRGLFNTSPILYSVGGFLVRLIIGYAYISWRLVMMMSLSMWSVMTCNLLHFPYSCWLEMSSITWRSDVVSFLPMIRIQTFVLFLARNSLFHGLLFSYSYMYDML